MRLPRPLLAASLLTCIAVVTPTSQGATAVKPASCSAAASGWKGEATGKRIAASRPAVERRVILLVNRFRRQHGVHALKLDPGLRSAARARGIIRTTLTARLALYTPSRCVVEHAVRQEGLRRAAGIVRHWRSIPSTRHALLLPWLRRIGVSVRIDTFKHKHVTITTVDFSAARPKGAKRSGRRPL